MAIFMASFRIAQVGNDDARRETLEGYLLQDTTLHWKETTSFLLFQTDQSIGTLASWAKEAIDTDVDVVLIREIGKLDARVVGQVDDPDLFKLMPYCREHDPSAQGVPPA